jgi:hypothetical protein
MGDSDFPKFALSYFKGGRILLLHRLYQMYSKLAFTNATDRSVALLGLENRLSRTFQTSADYGIVGEYFERTLLWKRESNNQLTRIQFPQDRRVPSWSWMSYIGAIDYLHVPFGETKWCENIESTVCGSSHRPTDTHGAAELKVATMELMASGVDLRTRVIRDNEDELLDEASLRCVVVGEGMGNSKADAERIYYVLVVRPSPQGDDYYERVGVGTLHAHHISIGRKDWKTLR